MDETAWWCHEISGGPSADVDKHCIEAQEIGRLIRATCAPKKCI